MMQQVNLLVAELTPRRERLTLVQLGAVWCAFVVLLLALSAWQAVGLWRLNTQQAVKQIQAERLEQANDTLRASFATTADPELQAQVDDLSKELETEALTVKAVKVYEHASGRGFAPYLKDLAAQHVDGLMLSRIELHDGGSRMVLSGETDAPVNVPMFLERLSDGASFRGHRFDEFRLEAQDTGLLHFDITGPQEQRQG